MTDLGESVEAKSIASIFFGVEELRSKGHEQDDHAIPLSQEMNPKGEIKLIVTYKAWHFFLRHHQTNNYGF